VVEEFEKMKKLFLLCAVLLAAMPGFGFLKIGAPAPDFAPGHWYRGKGFSLASVRGKKMTVILFWKPDHAGALGIQTFSKIAHQQRFRNVAFAAVAQGTLKAVANFPLNRQLTISEDFRIHVMGMKIYRQNSFFTIML
jgi:hypothetical protein